MTRRWRVALVLAALFSLPLTVAVAILIPERTSSRFWVQSVRGLTTCPYGIWVRREGDGSHYVICGHEVFDNQLRTGGFPIADLVRLEAKP